ncbi:MAG: hypothetical protein CMC93_05550 [Flavobacteriaceae bacterium]|nr:hypothetical protein [Flavobacteriaceae bacterium]|tara:strand:+ start:1691 stop:2635 length:945 start_codon:yes stop_codon:yes gene_type:complete
MSNKKLGRQPKLLALSAGGDRGAVLVGLLHGMYLSHGKERVDWTLITGISAGALVGSIVSQTIPETFDRHMEKAKDLFEIGGFHVVSPHTRWGFVINAIDAVLYYNSLYTNEPMDQILKDNFKENIMFTPLRVGAYNRDTCQYETFDKNLHQAILASTSVPIVYPPVKIGSHDYQDGGMRHIIPVEEIFEFIEEHKVCTVDVMICYPINCFELFFKAMTPEGYYPLIEESFRCMTAQMLGTLTNDLTKLADFLGISFEEIREKPCNSFYKDGVMINLFSPDDATYTNFTDIKPEEMKMMYDGGKRVIMEYLKPK